MLFDCMILDMHSSFEGKPESMHGLKEEAGQVNRAA